MGKGYFVHCFDATVLMPRIAFKRTLALNSPVKIFRYFSLTTRSFFGRFTVSLSENWNPL